MSIGTRVPRLDSKIGYQWRLIYLNPEKKAVTLVSERNFATEEEAKKDLEDMARTMIPEWILDKNVLPVEIFGAEFSGKTTSARSESVYQSVERVKIGDVDLIKELLSMYQGQEVRITIELL